MPEIQLQSVYSGILSMDFLKAIIGILFLTACVGALMMWLFGPA